MSKKISSMSGAKSRKFSRLRGLGLSLPALLVAAPAAHALQLYDGTNYGNNLEVNLNITVSYTGMQRVQQPSAILVDGSSNANGNDGDANLPHGIVNSTFDALPVLDIKDRDFGIHISGEYFVNTVYLGTNSNNQNSTVNPILPKPTDYASETRQANGLNGRLLDAFVYDSWAVGDGQQITLKAGQQTLFWGQSVFYGTNGIAGGQAPIDILQASNEVNPQTQQIFLPVGQVVATYQPNNVYTLQGYYQYQWEPDSFPGVGSYFMDSDVFGPGGYRIIAVPGATSNLYLLRTKDLSPPSQNGQFGASVQAQYGNYDTGLFALRYDSKTPEVYSNIGGFTPTPGGDSIGTYKIVYPRDIWIYGTSLSTTVGATNVAGEFSVHTHLPLVGNPLAAGSASPANEGNANNDPLYPVGNTFTFLTSAIYGSPALKFDPGGVTLVGEVEYLDLFRVTRNPQLLAVGRSPDAAAFDAEIEPAYFEVIPHLELQFPVSLSYNFAGNSEIDTTMNHGTGSYSVSVVATYKQTWDASLNYVGYYGNVGTTASAPEVYSGGGQVDRGYVSLNLQHTF